MADVRKLMAKRNNLEPATRDQKIDKLAETKRVERERKERVKAEQKALKAKKRETALIEAVKHRDERALSGAQTKRAAKDVREAGRREAMKEGASVCQHGIWKCRICHPQPHTGKVNHHQDVDKPALCAV